MFERLEKHTKNVQQLRKVCFERMNQKNNTFIIYDWIKSQNLLEDFFLNLLTFEWIKKHTKNYDNQVKIVYLYINKTYKIF